MYRKHNYRVDATRTAWLSLPALFVHGWDRVAGISTSPKPLEVESPIVNDELAGNPGGEFGHKSCPTPFVERDNGEPTWNIPRGTRQYNSGGKRHGVCE